MACSSRVLAVEESEARDELLDEVVLMEDEEDILLCGLVGKYGGEIFGFREKILVE